MADTTVNNNVYDEIHISGALAGPFQIGDEEAIVTADQFNDLNVMWSDDAGATWNTVEVEAGTVTAMCAWLDRDTPGDSGSLIHLFWLEAGVLKYATFSMVTHTASSVTTIATVVAGAANQGSSSIAATKTRNGNLLVHGRVDSSAGTDTNFGYRSTDGGSNWTSRTSAWEDENANYGKMFPANTGDGADAALIFYDDSALAISVKMLKDSDDTVVETAIASSMDPGAESVVFAHQNFDAKIRHSDGFIIVTCWNTVNNAAADLKVFSVDPDSITVPTVATLTDVVSNLAASARCALAIDQQTDDLYVFYAKGNPTFNTAMDVVYRKSTDGGTTWGNETAYSETNGDVRNLGAGSVFAAGGRIQASWFNTSANDIFVNLVNDVEIAAGGGGADPLPLMRRRRMMMAA